MTAWLHIPLAWYQSNTTAFYPDETHSSIKKSFTPLHTPHCKRYFCGFCGTHLSYWTEEPASEADYLNVTLGSLLGEDVRALKELNLLPWDVEPEELENEEAVPSRENMHSKNQDLTRRSERRGTSGDISWVEEMIDGSALGRTQKIRRGKGISADGTTRMQWEVSEYREGDSDGEPVRGKRKLGDVGDGDDVHMKS